MDSELNLCLSIYKREETGEFRDWWHGIALPEALSMEIRDHRRVLDLSFSCGLALLNDIDWKNADGSKKTGTALTKGALLSPCSDYLTSRTSRSGVTKTSSSQ